VSSILFDRDGRVVKGRRAEALEMELGYVWSNLLARGFLDSQRSLGFCAVEHGEGSGALALDLAVFLGARGRRVVVVEADMRAADMAHWFKHVESPGVAELLAGEAEFVDALRPQVAEGVDLMPAGRSKDPFWSYTGPEFQGVVGRLVDDYDMCFVACPPLNRAPEAGLVLRSLDASLLVVSAAAHREDTLRQHAQGLRSLGTPFLGVVLNDIVHEVPPFLARLT